MSSHFSTAPYLMVRPAGKMDPIVTEGNLYCSRHPGCRALQLHSTTAPFLRNGRNGDGGESGTPVRQILPMTGMNKLSLF